jgi:hypothetical protein
MIVGVATMPYVLPHAALGPPAAVALCFPDRPDGQFSSTVGRDASWAPWPQR